MADDPLSDGADPFDMSLGDAIGPKRRADDPDRPVKDGMHPPSVPQLVHCIHCDQEYDSWRIEWTVDDCGHGFWRCPIPGCTGAGFGMDIFPVDVGSDGHWTDPDGRELWWVDDDGDEDDDDAPGDQAIPTA